MRKSIPLVLLALSLPACAGMWPTSSTATATVSTQTRTPTQAPTRTAALPPLATVPATPQASFNDLDEQATALLPGYVSDVAALEGATAYGVEASVTFEEGVSRAHIEGVARIRYTNPGPESLSEIPLMLWPNDDQYRGRAQAGPAFIEGEQVRPRVELDGLAYWYALLSPLAAGESVDLSVPFQVRAEGPIGGERPYRFGITQDILFAPTFYPILPRLVDGDWEVEEAPPGGDTTTSLVAAYWVDLEVPADRDLVATGVEVGRQELGADRVRVRYVSGPARDFAFALGKFARESREVDGVAVHSWTLPTHGEDVDTVLDAAAMQLGLLNELIGPYPFTELDIVDVPGAYGGIEYPGLVTIGTLGGSWIVEPVVHEVAHQWFYGLIGDDQIDDPWLDEAFATYATALYYEHARGPERATGYLSDFREIVRNHPEGERPIGLGVGAYEGSSYSVLVYLKGALFYEALRREIGDEAFFGFLQDLYGRHRYGLIEPADFQGAAERSCACELDELFDRWVFEGGPLPFP